MYVLFGFNQPFANECTSVDWFVLGVLIFAVLFVSHREMIQKHEVCVRVLGNLSLLPEDIQRTVAEVVNMSKNNTK